MLVAAGAPIVAAPEDQPWGERVAQTRDPDGNLVYLGAALLGRDAGYSPPRDG
jgi:lactoylglutathione lyase